MEIKDVFIIGSALAMDALGVTISIGLSGKVDRNKKIEFIISFAFFQFLFFLSGAISGFLFQTYITFIPNIIGGTAIGIVGAMMIKEGFEEKKEDNLFSKKFIAVILGISVSIDALVLGFTSIDTSITYISMLLNSILVGLITLIICTTGFYLCRIIRKISFISKYADFLGGAILILFALKMIIL